jgi:hypothetical protein
MKRIIVKITDGKHSYEEDVTEEQKEHFNECKNNGANPWMEKIPFKQYTRPVKEDLMDNESLDKYNVTDKNAHFVFGWMEAFSQGDSVPEWMYNAEELTIEVRND